MTDPVALKGFNVMLQAEDDRGLCFVAYGVSARHADEAAQLASGAASADGFWAVEVDEVWEPEVEGPQDLGSVPEVFGRTDPTYVDEEEAFED